MDKNQKPETAEVTFEEVNLYDTALIQGGSYFQ